MGAVFSYSGTFGWEGDAVMMFQSLMGAVFSYSDCPESAKIILDKFQSLMGAVFSYSGLWFTISKVVAPVSIPDGCSVQL